MWSIPTSAARAVRSGLWSPVQRDIRILGANCRACRASSSPFMQGMWRSVIRHRYELTRISSRADCPLATHSAGTPTVLNSSFISMSCSSSSSTTRTAGTSSMAGTSVLRKKAGPGWPRLVLPSYLKNTRPPVPSATKMRPLEMTTSDASAVVSCRATRTGAAGLV